MGWGGLIFSLILGLIIMIAAVFLSDKNPDKEKTTPYECGFNPIYQIGTPFSIRFFSVGLLFLLFDLEIVILFPWAREVYSSSFIVQIMVLIFFGGLTLGLVYEWWRGILEWI